MRVRRKKSGISVHAISGTHVGPRLQYEIVINETFQGKREAFLWSIRHIDVPKERM